MELVKSNFKSGYGPWAVIIGASEKYGIAITDQLAAFNMHLILIDKDDLKHRANELHAKYGINVEVIQVNIDNPSTLDNVVNSIIHHDIGLLLTDSSNEWLTKYFLLKLNEKGKQVKALRTEPMNVFIPSISNSNQFGFLKNIEDANTAANSAILALVKELSATSNKFITTVAIN